MGARCPAVRRRPAMRRLRAWAALAVTAAAVLALDQATKIVVRAGLEPGETVELAAGISLVNVRNRGIAFGLLADGGGLLVLVTLGALALLLAYFAFHPERRGMWLAAGLVTGGAMGNLVDRIRDGAVTDFVDLPFWPAFNVADTAITGGVALLLLLGFVGGQPTQDRQRA